MRNYYGIGWNPKQSILGPLIVHLPSSAKFSSSVTNKTKANVFTCTQDQWMHIFVHSLYTKIAFHFQQADSRYSSSLDSHVLPSFVSC